MCRLPVRPREELQRVEARDRPDFGAHEWIGTAVTRNASHVRLLQVMEPGEIGGFGCREPEELLVMEMAGDTEAVVTLLHGERGEEKRPQEQGARDGGRAER